MKLLTILSSLLLFLLPFERIPSAEFFGITIRLSSFIVLFFLIFGVWGLYRRRQLWPTSTIDWSILILVLIMSVSVIWSADIYRAIRVVALFGFVLVGYLMISRTFRQMYDFERVQKITLWAAGVTAV